MPKKNPDVEHVLRLINDGLNSNVIAVLENYVGSDASVITMDNAKTAKDAWPVVGPIISLFAFGIQNGTAVKAALSKYIDLNEPLTDDGVLPPAAPIKPAAKKSAGKK